jgi:hypothetical protein
VGAPGVYWCGSAPRVYCCGGAEESKGGDGEGEMDVHAAAMLPRAVAPVGAPSAAAAGLHGEWRGYRKSCCCAEQRRFRKDQATRRDSVARPARSDNWRLAAVQGSQMTWPATTDVEVLCDSPPTRGSQEAEAKKVNENATKKSRTMTKRKGSERAALRRRKKLPSLNRRREKEGGRNETNAA